MIYQICDILVSGNTWDSAFLNISFEPQNSLTHQIWSIDRYKQGQYFCEILGTIWMAGANFRAIFNVAACSNYSIANYVKFPV